MDEAMDDSAMPLQPTDHANSRLCIVCARLDIRALLLASASIPESEDVTIWDRVHARTIQESPELFFRQHANLLDLKVNSEQCALCSSIWALFRRKAGGSKRLSDQALRSDPRFGASPVYITCTPANNLWQKFAQVVAFQKDDNDSTRLLCSFDPFAERGEFSSTLSRHGS